MEARLNMHRIRTLLPGPLLGLALLATVAGCASSQRPTVVQASAASEVSSSETQLAARQIEAMSLREGDAATYLDLTADDALVWTSYRDGDGNLVVELPNSVVASDVDPVRSADGLVAEVQVDQENGTSRPLTRLTVITRGEAEHSLAARGQRLELTLIPIAEAYGVDQVASSQPLPKENPVVGGNDEGLSDAIADEGETVELAAVSVDGQDEAVAQTSVADGDPDTWVGDAANQGAASMLQDVRLAQAEGAGAALKVAGDGGFEYSGFQLESPDRFVIDLIGIVNASSASTVAVDQGPVNRVRIAQFKPFPEPVTRVVFDLASSTSPTITQLPDGLLVSFGGAVASASAAIDQEIEQGTVEPETIVAEAPAAARETASDAPAAEGEQWAAQEEVDTRSAWEREYGDTDVEGADADALYPADDLSSEGAAETTVAEVQQPAATEPTRSDYSEAQVINAPESSEQLAEASEPALEPAQLTPLPEPAEQPQLAEQSETVAPPAAEPVESDPVGDFGDDQLADAETDDSLEDSYYAAWGDEESTPDAAQEVQVAEVDPAPASVPEPLSPLPAEEVPAAAPSPTSDVALFEAAQVEYAPPAQQSDSLTTTVGGTQVIGEGGKIYSGDLITFSLQDADIKDVLRSFSRFTGLNVVVHPGVRGSVTVELTDVPWDQALDLVLKINGLDYVLEGNIMRIASTSQLEQEAAARRALAAARAQEVPLQTVIRAVSYADANQIARLLTTGTGGGRGNRAAGILSSRGAVTVDRRTNKLIIKELPTNMNTVLAIIANLDTAEPQVLIEARIVETTKSFSRSLGINWQFNAEADDRFGNSTGLAFPHRASASGGVNLITGGNSGFLDISLGNILDTFTLDASLAAAENEGLVSILSSPKIATLNNQEARIESGLQIPVQTVSNNTVSVQFVNATLSLEVTPQVTAEGTVIMDIDIAKREPQLAFAIAGATNAPIATKQARTRVIVRDGGTTVIGGIYEVSTNRGEDRVPGLANVPILGYLFKNRRNNNDNDELLIFITPRVIQL
ncbi:MAG: type IV pilus secretin PilQ [Acidobacteriota bacterium]